MSEHEEELVQRASSGDQIAVDALLARFLPGLRAFVSRRVADVVRAKESSADLVQSVCREVLEHAGRFEHRSEAGFRSWLFRTAERKLVDRFRHYSAGKRDVAREVEGRVLWPGGLDAAVDRLFATPSRAAMAREQLARARRALSALPEVTQQVIILSRVSGWTTERIASRLGRKPSTIRSLLCRGLAAISDALDDEHSDHRS